MVLTDQVIIMAGVQALSEYCRRSFFNFFCEFWDTIESEELILNWHIKYLCNELQDLSRYIIAREAKPYDLIINIPPGTTKSRICTIMWPAWLWTQDASLRIITNSYSADLAEDHSSKSRDVILSLKYQKLFPHVRLRQDRTARSNYETRRKGARYTTSTGGTITGKHAHVIINDDPLNPGQASSEAMRKAANNHTATLATRKVDKANTPTVTIMQRLHEDDVTGYLLAQSTDGIKHICLPAEISDEVHPIELKQFYTNGLLDPIRLSPEVLQEQKTALGTQMYAGQYDQQPYNKAGNLIRRDWFPITANQSLQQVVQQAQRQRGVHFYIDTAYTTNTKNDPTGVIAVCDDGNSLLIIDAVKVYLEFPELCKWLPNYVRQMGYNHKSTVRIEPKANGLSLIQQLRRYTQLNIVAIDTPTTSKVERANAASPTLEAQRVKLMAGVWNAGYLDEMAGFPTAKHDEYVDITGYAVQDFNNRQLTYDNSDLEQLEIIRGIRR